MTMPIQTPDQKLNRTELMVAIVALLFLLVARPLLAQTANINPAAGTTTSQTVAPTNTTSPYPSNTTGVTPPGGSINPQTAAQTTSPSSTTIPSYVRPTMSPSQTDSQLQREASARQNGGTSLNPQAMPECRIDDSNCIQQRNQLNQTNPQLAPTFNR